MKPKHLVKKLTIIQIVADEKGIFLITAMMLVAILGMLSTIIVMTVNTDVKISGNYRTSIKANFAAEAGIDEIRARLYDTSDTNFVGDTSDPFDKRWAAYVLTSNMFDTDDDPTYNPTYYDYYIPISGTPTNPVTNIVANSLQSDIEYYARIKHKREYDAEEDGHETTTPHYIDNDGSTTGHASGDPGNIIYYGYGDPADSTNLVQYSTSTATTDYPVEVISVMGMSGGSTGFVEVEVVHNIGVPILGTLYSEEDSALNGRNVTVSGDDNCGGTDVDGAYTLDGYTLGKNNDDGTPPVGPTVEPTNITGSTDLDIEGYIEEMKDDATVIITPGNYTGETYGSASNYVTCYANGNLTLSNPTGYGILLVDGDLTLSGGMEWHGLILSTGHVKITGGASPNQEVMNISGSLLASQGYTLNGTVSITYDSCAVDNAMNSYPLDVINWQSLTD